ncbi:hypothetical protein RND81_10G190100 [Saponaria officinalis]|uniref:Beta-hexosaminidase n=1 Tax=Saponaria officinalis TaxID=3572 RepID=A0AAW1I442_SAPOF
MGLRSTNNIPIIAIIINLLLFTSFTLVISISSSSSSDHNDVLTYVWPLPAKSTSGNQTLAVDPDLSLSFSGNSNIIDDAFRRYKRLVFDHATKVYGTKRFRRHLTFYDVRVLRIVVHSPDEELQLGVDESYTLKIGRKDNLSFVESASIEANTIYGALRALETFSQLCTFDYETKNVVISKAPWYIEDMPRFPYRGLLIDTSRHYLPTYVIKQIIDSMSYAKLNVLHWHIIDEESFPIETPTYPYLWKGAYSKWERYTVEDANEIVNFAKTRGVHVMPEMDVPGHARSWGVGYPDLWPSSTCKEPLDVSKNFTFDVISGILNDLRSIFPFELFHLGGDEVNTGCWNTTPHIKQWLIDHNMTTKDAYRYFVLEAQELAISNNRTPVNWEETFITFPTKLNPKTVIHNWLVSGICPRAVAKGFRCIYSDQGAWYLDHLNVPWETVYNAEPLKGISNVTEQQMILGGEVCTWGERVDTSDIFQTIWPRAAAAAERLWSNREVISSRNITQTILPRLQYFRCLLNMRGVQAAPVTNQYSRRAPINPGSCFEQ